MPSLVIPSVVQCTASWQQSKMALQGECQVCGEGTYRRCGRCKQTYYCSKEHQTADWKCHKMACKWVSSSRAHDSHLTSTIGHMGTLSVQTHLDAPRVPTNSE